MPDGLKFLVHAGENVYAGLCFGQAPAKSMTAPTVGGTPAPLSFRDALITRTGRPRATRPNLQAVWLLLVLALVAVWAAAIVRSLFVKWIASASTADFFATEWYALFGLLILVAFEVHGLRSARRERELMKNGEVAIASVLSQKHIIRPRGSTSRLTYAFEDTHGIKYQGSCTDNTRKLFTGMSFLIFFERDLPMTRLESCRSNFDIVLPSEQ
jgi:hypothetical protein